MGEESAHNSCAVAVGIIKDLSFACLLLLYFNLPPLHLRLRSR